MMRSLILVALVSSLACRNLSEVGDQDQPRFLGEYSGVYEGIDQRAGVDNGTFIVHLDDKLLISPYLLDRDGTATLSYFANVLTISGDGETGADLLGAFALNVRLEQFYGSGTRCANDVELTSATEFFELAATCLNQGCDMPCLFPDMAHFEDSVWGTCADDRICLVDGLELGGRVGPNGVDVYFDQLAIAPPSRTEIACPTDATASSGKQWVGCYRYDRLCDFDSRLAGIFEVQLAFEPLASSGSATETSREFDLAVAVTDNLSAAILFDGQRVFFGSFEPFSLSFDVNDGEGLGAPHARVRGADDLPTRVTGQLVESADGDLVLLEGTWTETTGDGVQYVYALTGQRNAGSEAGRTCPVQSGCRTDAPICPGGSIAGAGQELLLSSRLNEQGCVITDCMRIAQPDLLCPDASFDCQVPGGAGFVFEGFPMTIQTLDLEVRCADGSDDCAAAQSCLAITCADPETATQDQFAFVDDNCADLDVPILFMLEASYDMLIVSCVPEPPYCNPLYAPICPLGTLLPGVTSSLEPIITEPCFQEVCWQNLRNTATMPMLCPGSDWISCTGVEVPIPHLRDILPPGAADGYPDCVEFLCEERSEVVYGVGYPCYQLPSSHLPLGLFDPAHGVDVADLGGCPLYRPHLP